VGKGVVPQIGSLEPTQTASAHHLDGNAAEVRVAQLVVGVERVVDGQSEASLQSTAPSVLTRRQTSRCTMATSG